MSTEIEQLHEEQATIIEGGKTLPAIFHTSPFASAVQYAAVVEGSTLETVVQQAAVKLPAEYSQYLRVWINDIEISREQWATTRVKAGQNVYIRVVPGKSGKDIFKMIALIAIAVVAWQFAPQIAATIAGGSATAGTITATLGGKLLVAGVMTAINVVGFLALNALIPPPSLGSMTQDDPRFDLTSTSNQFSPFANVPRLFGKRRLFPMMAARPYSELQGDDEYLRMALVVGWGPLKIENIKIGETPITAFKNVEYEVREGWSTDADLTLFTRTVTEENLSIRLEPFQSTGYYPGGYGYGGEYYTYNPDTQAYGPFSATTSNDWVERTTAVNSVEFSVDLAFPQGLFYFDNKGNKKQATVIVEVQYRPVGGTTWVNAVWDNSQDDGFGTNGQITAKAADSSAIRRSGRVKLPSAGQYTVRLRRITANSGDKYVDVSYWTCLRSIRPDYPVLQKNVALIAIRMKASNQLNGVPQTISCEATSYLPVWNGSTWSYQLSANPAWAYADLLRRRGGETLLTDDRIDLTTIKAWADACDATAPNATEPRWSYSDVLEGGSIFDNMRRVASNARAFPIVRDGKHSIVRDIPQTVPVQHITPRNSFGYSGVKSFIDYPHAMRVTFFNKDMGYQRDERIVYYDGYTAANATKFETLELQGCTSATQAFREARYHMAVARLRPEEHSVSMDIEALRCTVGDLVRFSHDAIAIGIAATRVRSYTLDGTGKVATITFEDDLYFEAGKSYVIRARQVTGNSVLLSINNPGEGYANTVTLTTPAVTTAAPDIGDLVIFGEATKESAPMIIKKIDADDDFACTVHMVDAADAVHTADTGTIPAFNTLLSLPSESTTTDVPKVFISAVRSDDSVVITNPDGSLSYRILTQLQQPESSTARVDYFEVQHRIQNSSAWHTTTVERANGFGYIDGVEVGAVYELRSRAVPVDGQPSDWSTSVTHTVVGKLSAPNLPTGLSATAIPGGIDLAWTNSTSDDFWQVEIYENTTSNSATATKVAETSANKYSRLGLSSADGVRFYWLKSLNTSGVSTAFVGPVSTTALNRVLLGTLSSEAVNLPADAAGVVSSFLTAEGQLSVTDGPTNVLASATLSATASGCTGTVNTAADTPVAGKPKGYYRVTAMSAETGTLTITATYNGQSVNKVFSVTKARTGAQGNPASVLTLSSSAQTFTYDGSGAASPSSQSITLTANLQNIGAAVTFDATGYNAAGTSLGTVTLTGTGNSRSLSLANFGAAAYVVVTATASGFSDTTTIVRLAAGAPGAQPITGFLTNEAATLAAATDGTVSSFTPAGGTFKVFEGLTDRTGTSVTYTVQSSSNVTISISTAGVYTVTAMSADTATATLRAVYGGVTIDKALSLSKSRQGVPGNPASVLTLTSTAQTMTFDGTGNLSPASQSITFTANLQNVTGTATFAAVAYNSAGLNLSNITLDGTGNTRTLTSALFTGNAGTAYVVVTATLSGLSDTTTVVRLQAGAPGTQPITGFLTNEAATLAAATDGTVSDFAPAGGTFRVFEGITDRTGSPTYTVQSSSNATVSISAAGVYSVTAMSADTATATLRAVFGGVTIDKVLNLSKSRQGVPGNNASILTLTSTAQAITFDGLGSASPASQTITFTANLQNLSGTAAFTATAFSAANANLGTITLGGSGNARTLSNTLFSTHANTAYVTVSATLSGFTDSTTVVRLQAGAKGDPGNDAIVGFLTNEAVTLAATATGVVSDFAPAGGTFKVFQGLTDRTTNSTFTVSSSTNCTVSINGTTGVYSVSAMTADTASATLQAVFGGATIQKVLSLAKSKTGGVGDPGTAAISGYVTNEAIQLFAFADGTVTSYTGASGSFRIFSGNTDISSSFTLATGVSGNPQNLTVSYNLRDYSITGGFDANEDTASLTIRATGSGAYAGVTLDKVVSLSKAKGGYEIVGALPTTNNFAGRVVFLNTDGKLYRYIGAPTNAYIASVAAADVSGTLGSTQIADGAITSGKIGDGQVGSGKIADGAIATIKIADSAITAAKITDATISTAKIADSAITAVKIGNGAVSSAKFAAGIEPVGVFTGSALPTSQTTSTIYLTGTGKLYRWVGGAYSAVVDTGDLNGTISSAQIADGALTSGKFATGIEPVTVVSSLPASLSTRSVFNTSDNKLYRWNGSTYVATIPTTDLTGTIATAQIADGALTSGKFAAGIEPVTVVSSVPASQSTRSIFNTADNKLYRWNGSAYVATVPTTDLTGTIANTQIASVAATKITGVVGGGNLLANSGFKNFTGTIDTNGSLPASWAVYNNQGISITHRVVAGGLFGTNYVRLTANANTNQTFGVYGNTATGQYAGLWQPGLTYMLSFWARAGNAAAVGKTMSALFSNMGFASATQVENPPLVEGTWQRYVWRAVPANNANTPNSEFYISLIEAGPPPAYTITSGGILEICAPQVEQGELVSAYAPRPDEILPSSITATEIANDAVTSNKIIAGAVVAGKIATGAVEADKIAANAVTAAKINAGAVEADKIAANAVTAVKINAGAVEADKIAANAVTAVKINAGAVEADKIAANAVTAGKINAGAVEADKIAANAVTAVKINAGAVEADKIAANAVTAVKINAAAVEADKIASNAVTADKIAANAVTAGKIQAGAVSTDKLAANSITASKLAIVAAGMALNRDPQMATDAWLLGIGGSTLLAANTQFTNTTQNDSPVGTSVLQYSGSTGADWSSEIIPIDSSKVYRISLWARQTGASLHYITAAFMNATGAYLSGGGTGWNSGTYHYWGRGNQPFPSTWTFYSVVFGPGQAFTAPAGAKFIRLAMLQNYGSTATDTVYMADYRIEEVLPSTLIQNGAIVTDKLAANAVTAAKIAANTITANEIAASTITSNQIATDTIVAGNIAAGAIGASEIAANAVTAVKINASAVEADKIAANAVTADKIAANAITAGKIAAGSIATNALVVTGRGAAINDDPLCQDPTAWKDGEHGTTATRVTITDAPSGDSAYRSNAGTVGVSNSGASGIETSKLYPVSSSKKYRLTAFVRTVGGAGVSYLRLVDQVGNQIFISNLEGFAPSSTWTRYSGFYQPSASVKSVRLRAILNWTGTTGYHEVTDFRLEEMSEADLIVDGAIVANKIAANAITAAKIASNSITTSKLLVTATANSISDDPMFQDPSAWELTPNTSFLSGTGEAGAVANTYIGSSVGTDQQNQSVKSYPIGPGKRYRLSANLYASAGNARNMYIYVEFYDQNGAYIGSGVTGWGGSKSGYTYGGQPPTGVWTRQGGQFGPGTGREIPANTRSVKIGIWFNYSSGSGLVFQACQDLRLEEVVEADIIADGAIIANKVAANAITAEKINANAVTADKINAGAVTAAKINVTSLSAISATVGTLQTATTGARVQIKDNIIKVFDGTSTSDTTGIRVKIGDLSL